MFICFEGGEGSGKTTQSKFLYEYLVSQGHKTLATREPGGVKLGEQIRNLLLSKDNNYFPVTELLLFNAARYEHVEKIIKPAIREGQIVICDRFLLSTIAYQSYGNGIDYEKVITLHNMFMHDISPDITIYLDIDPKIGIERVKTREMNQLNKYEILDNSYHERVRNGFLEAGKKLFGDRFCIFDATKSKNEIHQLIKDKISKFL